MTGRRHYWLLAFALLWLAPLEAYANAETKPTGTNLPDISLDFDAKSHELEFVVRNAGTSTVSVFDSLTGQAQPHFLMVRFLGKDGHIMSENSFAREGFISRFILDADIGIKTPVTMTLLSPGQRLVTHIQLGHLVGGLERYMSTQIRNGGDYCVQFKAQVFTDPNLKQFVEKTSTVTCLTDFEGFQRTGNSNSSGITIGDPTLP